MPSDYISRDATFKLFEDEPWADDNERDYAEDLLLNVPSAPVESVVHCSECIHKDSASCPVSKYENRGGESFYKTPIVLKFCSYGKRKDGAE